MKNTATIWALILGILGAYKMNDIVNCCWFLSQNQHKSQCDRTHVVARELSTIRRHFDNRVQYNWVV